MMTTNTTLEISKLWTASGKTYQVVYNGLFPGTQQYIDRDYEFDYVPARLKGKILIKTAGNDKMYEEDEICLRFEVDRKVVVYVLHANKFTTKPAWLHNFKNTGDIVTRTDCSEATMKGIFTVFAREYPAGSIALGGCLPPGFLTPSFRQSGGENYCMYSVVVAVS